MIDRLQLLRNIGQFDNVSPATTLALSRLTLIYAENGRGKTTLAAVLRSLGTGEAMPINERRRLGAAHPPEVVIACDGNAQPAKFQNSAWSRTCPGIMVFDDVFVDRNVYSGLDVAADHRQNLHELIVGAPGVALARQVDDLASQIRGHNSVLREKGGAIPTAERHGLSIDDFCALAPHADIDRAITEATQRIAAQQQAASIHTTSEFVSLALPAVEVAPIKALLARTVDDLDAQAAATVRTHLSALGKDGEEWVASGMKRIPASSSCPFCEQSLAGSSIFPHYRKYFVDAYEQLKAALFVAQTRIEKDLRGDALAGFERQVKAAEELRRFWSTFTNLPELAVDTVAVAHAWQELRDGLAGAIKRKRAEPLAPFAIDAQTDAAIVAFVALARQVGDLSGALLAANENIQRTKEATKTGDLQGVEVDLNRLRATKARHSPAMSSLCAEYLKAKADKEQAERDKETAQKSLDAHQATVFPSYQTTINTFLAKLNAGFSVEQVQPQRTPGRPSCTYNLVVHSHRIPVSAAKAVDGAAAFKNTLSAGDRNTLALAFFFASLELDPARANKIIVLDDPVSSLDEHRCVATIQEARAMVARVAQVFVLSHNKAFLARIWQHADKANTASLAVTRDTTGSTIEAWDVTADSVTEYDKRHARLRDYMSANRGNTREVAQSIRPVLEGYMRVACPMNFPPGQLLGRFINEARQQATVATPIIADVKLTELDELVEYSNRFHHDTNPAWDSEHINDAELMQFVGRTIAFGKL